MKFLLVFAMIFTLTSSDPQTQLKLNNSFKNFTSQFKPRIINGNEAVPHSIPYQAFLELYPISNEGPSPPCSGSLITRSYILTSASCVYGISKVYVTLGVHNLLGFEETRLRMTADLIKINANWRYNNLTDNIALIGLPQPVPLTNAIYPVKLPKRTDVSNTYEGVTARISGWGATAQDQEYNSNVLKYADVKVISNEECAKDVLIVDAADSVICTSAGQDNVEACHADGGDPLVVDGVQIGISLPLRGCPLTLPAVYTRITPFLDWIEKHSDIVIDK